MGFKEHLEGVVSTVSGSVACSLMGFDGIAVDTHQPDDRAGDAATMELTNALTEYGTIEEYGKGNRWCTSYWLRSAPSYPWKTPGYARG